VVRAAFSWAEGGGDSKKPKKRDEEENAGHFPPEAIHTHVCEEEETHIYPPRKRE